MPQGLLPRLLLGLVVAAILIGGLQWSASAGGADADRPPVDSNGAESSLQDPAAGGRGVLAELSEGVARLIYLARQPQNLPQGTAPILAIEPGGVIRLQAPPPLADRPGPAVWPKLGILLPRERLSALLPAERASLLRIWTTVSGGGGVSPGQIVARDLDYRPEEVLTLLRWQR